mmetsp:Transcript_116599/g.341267  ORF Transcript_116599/g.341267 Transcript_116599/m.341267 type:complete len:354 (-) Transcript_116599:532-1593(-)
MHDLRELVVAVRHVLVAPRQRAHDVCQRGEAPVDLDGFLQSWASDVGALDPFGAREIDEGDLAPGHLACLVVHRGDLQLEEHVRARALGVPRGAPDVPACQAGAHEGLDVRRAADDPLLGVLEEDFAILHGPDLERPVAGIQEIYEALAVELHHAEGDGEAEAPAVAADDPKDLLRCPGADPPRLVGVGPKLPPGGPRLRRGLLGQRLPAVHRVRLARSCLAIGKDRHVVAVNRTLNEVAHTLEHLLLRARRPARVEGKRVPQVALAPGGALGAAARLVRGRLALLPALAGLDLDAEAVPAARGHPLARRSLGLGERPDPALHADGAPPVLDSVVDAAAVGVQGRDLLLRQAC